MPFYVYILKMKDGRLYVGQTSDLSDRFQRHSQGNATQTTKIFGYKELIYKEEFTDRISALARERQLKGWSRAKKLALTRNDIKSLKKASKRKP